MTVLHNNIILILAIEFCVKKNKYKSSTLIHLRALCVLYRNCILNSRSEVVQCCVRTLFTRRLTREVRIVQYKHSIFVQFSPWLAWQKVPACER